MNPDYETTRWLILVILISALMYLPKRKKK